MLKHRIKNKKDREKKSNESALTEVKQKNISERKAKKHANKKTNFK